MRWRSPLPLLLFLILSLLADGSWGQSSGFRICAFNVQNLDTTKISNTRIAHTLTRLLSRCDICLLQEVKDPQHAAIKVLVKALNSNTSDRYEDANQYQFVSSKPLGNSDNLQQYVFIYRKNTVNVTGEHQYQTKKSFVRPPFVVRFQSNRTAIGEFVLVPLHTDPQNAVQEINHLYDVFQEVSKKWETKNLMFLGDFNAGCAHMTRPSKKNIRLFTEKGFYWLIGDKVDTTVTDLTNCPYDRIVVHGEVFLKHIKPYSAKVFNFAKEYRLSKDRVLKVSDHFPVEVQLSSTSSTGRSSSALRLQATPLHLLLSLSVILWYCLTDHEAV